MNTLREAAQFALDALHCPGDSELMGRVEQKLREALAEQEPDYRAMYIKVRDELAEAQQRLDTCESLARTVMLDQTGRS
jgi:hypothetical protein